MVLQRLIERADLSDPLLERLQRSLDKRTEELHWLKGQQRDIAEHEYILKVYPALFVNFWGGFICRSGSTNTNPSLATEAQAFSLMIPEIFFDLYSPPRRELKARERIDQTLKFLSMRVSSSNEANHIVVYLIPRR